MAPARSTVFVADDHPLYREGMTRAIAERPDLDLVGEASDGRAALEQIVRLRPAVALLDVKMPRLDGLQVLRALRRDGIATAVVFLSANLSSEVVYHAVAGGASAFLSKDADRDTICDAVVAAARGEMRLSPEIQALLAKQVQLRARVDLPQLTNREREVLGMIAEGMSAPEIAEHLTLSTATIKSHLQSLYDKLGVNDRAAAVATAMRTGLLE